MCQKGEKELWWNKKTQTSKYEHFAHLNINIATCSCAHVGTECAMGDCIKALEHFHNIYKSKDILYFKIMQ